MLHNPETETKNEVHEGRWGYYPCSHEEFLELKKAHKLVLRGYRDTTQWIRWIRKDPHNRKGPEPLRLALPHLENRSTAYIKWYWAKLYSEVLEVYRNSRYPVASPEEVRHMELSDEAKEVIKKLKAFYADKDTA
jgi:hypothetical protein